MPGREQRGENNGEAPDDNVLINLQDGIPV